MKQTLTTITLLIGASMLAQGEDKPGLPNVLIIGDSISIGYTEPLKEMLKDKANVSHNPGNAGDSNNGLAKLESWLGTTKWDVIHFNHGLHDLKYVDNNGKISNTKQDAHINVPLDKYRENMAAIVVRLKKTGARLIFATTTPYPAGVRPLRVPEDAEKYNAAALEIMQKHGISVNDLHAFILPRLQQLQTPKNVRFTPAGYKALAQEVGQHVLKACGQPSSGDLNPKAALQQ